MDLKSNNKELELGNKLFSSGGLSNNIVIQRQESDGFNELPTTQSKKIYSFFLDVLKEPMVYLLIGCGIIYFFLGDQQEAIMLLAFLFLIIAITIVQETRAGKALEALKDLSSPRALVLRNGKKIRISGREVVREEIIFINEGDRVPADGLLISASNLSIDESLLTGESVPVDKKIEQLIFASTTVIRGQGIALINAIGSNTQIGIIGSSLKENSILSTKLEEQTNLLVKKLAWIATVLCILVSILYSATHHNWIEGTLVGISLAMAILPNELPAVLTIFFAMSAWRLSKRNILTRKISAVENLGSTTVLCVDKTGTLTLNQMSIQNIYAQEKMIDLSELTNQVLPEEFHETLEYAILASRQDPIDPMELAFTAAGIKYLKGTEHLHFDWNLEKEYPISPELLSITHAWKKSRDNIFVIGAKGSPEAIFDLCHLDESQMSQLSKITEEMASIGLRILGVAKSILDNPNLPSKQHDFTFTFLGLIGIADPIRSGIQESILECYSAGIRVIMLTGDHPLTASSIAKKIGLRNPTQVITGGQMESLTDLELVELTKNISLFSRVMPSHKLRLVEVLKSSGEIVAMTGDGVNDAPALKAAHIGIAMGGRGTDVARESSDIVLLDDDFSSIVDAIRAGRTVYNNIKNAIIYLFAIHIPIAGISILPVLLRLPIILLPGHIALIHLIIEPSSSIAFEIEPPNSETMKKKPRSPTETLFNKEILNSSLLRGATFFFALATIYFISFKRHQDESVARTLVFTTLVFANTFLIYLSRAQNISLKSKFQNRPNRVVQWLILASLTMIALVLYVPALREIFRFSLLLPFDIFICIFVSTFATIFIEVAQALLNKKKYSKLDQLREIL